MEINLLPSNFLASGASPFEYNRPQIIDTDRLHVQLSYYTIFYAPKNVNLNCTLWTLIYLVPPVLYTACNVYMQIALFWLYLRLHCVLHSTSRDAMWSAIDWWSNWSQNITLGVNHSAIHWTASPCSWCNVGIWKYVQMDQKKVTTPSKKTPLHFLSRGMQ